MTRPAKIITLTVAVDLEEKRHFLLAAKKKRLHLSTIIRAIIDSLVGTQKAPECNSLNFGPRRACITARCDRPTILAAQQVAKASKTPLSAIVRSRLIAELGCPVVAPPASGAVSVKEKPVALHRNAKTQIQCETCGNTAFLRDRLKDYFCCSCKWSKKIAG